MKWSRTVANLMVASVVIAPTAGLPGQVFETDESSTSPVTNARSESSWVLALPPGTGRFPEVCGAGQWPMAIVPLVGLEGKLWMVGEKTVWSSSDGIRFRSHPKTDWGTRAGMVYVFFRQKMWMLGGMRAWDDFRNDVWSSSDGTDWKQATAGAAWSARRNHGALVFQNKMWVLGGAVSSGRPDQTPSRFLNDVWSTEDGEHWTQMTDHAPWSARDGHVCLVLDEKMWVIGGAGLRDVWYSSDGRTWTQATPQAEWGERQDNGGLAFDGKLWIFGGRGLNDVWHSQDGARWQQAAAHAPWSTRTAVHSVAFDNKLWIYSGKTGREDSWAGDVWSMVRTGVETAKRR